MEVRISEIYIILQRSMIQVIVQIGEKLQLCIVCYFFNKVKYADSQHQL